MSVSAKQFISQREFYPVTSRELMVKIINVLKTKPTAHTHSRPSTKFTMFVRGGYRVHLLDSQLGGGTGVKIPMDYLVFLMWFNNNSKLRVLLKNSCQ